MQNIKKDTDVSYVLKNQKLKAMPRSAVDLLRVCRKKNVGPQQAAVPVEADPGLTAQVLAYVNSSYFGFSRRISSIPLAINLVGINTIKNYVLWKAMYDFAKKPKIADFKLNCLWQDSLRRAIFCREAGQRCGLGTADEIFCGGLMQDVALPMLVNEYPEEYQTILDRTKTEQRRISDLEMETFGWDHSLVGALFCEKWNFPTDLTEMIRQHSGDKLSRPCSDEETIVSLSAMLPSAISETWEDKEDFYRKCEEEISNLCTKDILQKVDDEFERMAPAINISSECKSFASFEQETDSQPTQ